MSTTENQTMNATQIIVDLAEQHITNAIVNAAKGKPVKKSKKGATLADEIMACFNL